MLKCKLYSNVFFYKSQYIKTYFLEYFFVYILYHKIYNLIEDAYTLFEWKFVHLKASFNLEFLGLVCVRSLLEGDLRSEISVGLGKGLIVDKMRKLPDFLLFIRMSACLRQGRKMG